MSVPNLVIAGAPKCGTSTLFRWLCAHPSVCGSNPKEPFFLMDPEHPLRRRPDVHDVGLAGYAQFFPKGAEHDPIRLEATTHYLYQRTAPRVLAQMREPPLVVFMLREPASRVASSFAYTRHNLASVDPALTFAHYVDLVLTRPEELSRWVRGQSAYVLARDVDYSRYSLHLRRWAEVFPRKQMIVRSLEQMRRDPVEFISDLVRMIGLDWSFYLSFPFQRHNETLTVQFPRVHRVARWAAARLPTGHARESAGAAYRRVFLGTGDGGASGEDELALTRLGELFTESNAELAREYGIEF